MSAVQSNVFKAFRNAGVAEDAALDAAATLAIRDEDIQTIKQELKTLKRMMIILYPVMVLILIGVFGLH